jgi:CubicO group peptidase (beta-lactamase class C family)
MADIARWQARLDELAAEHQVPGASLAILHEGAVAEAATGVLNVDTGVEATTDSLFQIGSITKLYTATLVMQLADEGGLALDAPVMSVLPELRLADPEAARHVTMRHLLTHTSGIEGDHFEDTGRGDDVLARYVESCAGLGFSHPVGATMSYCNTGFVIAGRVVERLCGGTWDAALRERLIEPLGLQSTVTLPEEALRYRVAHGHVGDPGEAPRLAPVWSLPRSLGPAGLICSTAADLLGFARAHLDGGRAGDGTRVLSAEAAAAMLTPQVRMPDPWTLGSHWGIGWILFDWDGRQVYGHDGGTIGQTAILRMVPDAGVAVALLTNGGHAEDLYQDLYRELFAELCGIELPRPLEPPAEPPHTNGTSLAGRYERASVLFELEDRAGGELAGRLTMSGLLAELDDPVEEFTLVPVAERVYVTRFGDARTWTPAVFYELPDGSSYLHMSARATPKVA